MVANIYATFELRKFFEIYFDLLVKKPLPGNNFSAHWVIIAP
jgi:hypothetical protein